MTDINIFAPPPDATLDRIVAANRPRVMARVHRHWWQRFTATKSFTVMSGLSIFAAGALVSAAVLVPQLRPGEANLTIKCYDESGRLATSLLWGGADAPPNGATVGQARADPAGQCETITQAQIGFQLVNPIATSLVASGDSCGRIEATTGQIYGFEGNRDGTTVLPPDALRGNMARFADCPLFNEPINIPVIGVMTACRQSSLVAAVYPAGEDTQAAVCHAYGQPIWTGTGR